MKVGFIGFGNMATAMAAGFVKSRTVRPENIIIYSPNAHTRENIYSVAASNFDVYSRCDIVIFACKPYHATEVIAGISSALDDSPTGERPLLLSVMLGVSFDAFAALQTCNRVLVMPNTPCMVGESASCYVPEDGFHENNEKIVRTLLESIGMCIKVPERLIPAVVGVAGSAPVYFYEAIDAVAEGGVKHGLSRQQALLMAAQTCMGAAKMVIETGKHPSQLKDEVCSPGGATIAGVHAMHRARVRTAYHQAVDDVVEKCKK